MALFAFILLLGISLAGGMESGIIGGREANPHSRPYMASIQFENKHHTCGGMLIRKDYVLTTAHCWNASSGQGRLEVVLGAHNIKKNESSQQRIKVMKYIQHPKFLQNDEKDYSYDIMLLKLKNNAKLNKFVKVMPLYNGTTTAKVKCSIAGWGFKTPKATKGSNVLQEVSLKLLDNSKCEESWQHYFNSERMVCGASDGKHAFCRGDSGSPLICNAKAQAIASYTYDGNCANKTYPQVYVNVPYFLHWIKKNIA